MSPILIVAIVAAVAVGGVWTYYSEKLALMRSDLAAAQKVVKDQNAKLTTCESTKAALETTNRDWKAQTDAQNRELREIKEERDRKSAEAAAAAARAAKADGDAKARASELLALKAPEGELERCRAAEGLGRAWLRARKAG